MIEAKHNILIDKFFKAYIFWKIRRNFHELIIRSDFKPSQKPLLFVANHVSWWDGFWVLKLNSMLFKKKIHVMLLESQLMKNPILKFSGAFSINPGSKSVVETLKYSLKVLENQNNMLVMYPQGVISSLYSNRVEFKDGGDFLVKKLGDKVDVVMGNFFVEYLSNLKPTLFCYLKRYDAKTGFSLEDSFNQFYNESLDQQRKTLS